MEIKVYSGNTEVVSSGVVFVRHGESADFKIENLKFRLVFKEDDAQKPHVKCEVEKDSDTMIVKCFNFKGSLLARLNWPLLLAHFSNKALTLQFSVSSLNKRTENGVEVEDHMIIYSWCLES